MKMVAGESEYQTAVRNFLYAVGYKLGIIWLAKKIGMELRPQYKLRDNDPDFWKQYE